MDGLVLLFLLAVVVTLLCAWLVISSLRCIEEKAAAPLDKPARQPDRDWTSWIFYFGIALCIAIWTIWGALLLLVFINLIRLDPKPSLKEAPFPSDTEKRTAKQLYIWLLLSPSITVPTFIIAVLFLSYNPSINERVIAALIPLIFHAPLLLGFTSKSIFVFRHTQQAILLVAVRAALASLAISIGEPGDGLWLFLIGNGVLWLGGSLLGLDQTLRGQCWIMEKKGEKIAFSYTGKADSPQMDKELEDILKFLNAKDQLTAKTKALHAFRAGTPESKRRAVEVLSKLGEVEEF